MSLPSVSLDIPDKPGLSITHHIWGTEDKAHDTKGTVMIHFVGFCLFFVKLYSMIWLQRPQDISSGFYFLWGHVIG